MGERDLKVYEATGNYARYTPCIRLQGQWLKNLGFNTGDRIIVKEEAGRLIIELADRGHEDLFEG